MKAKAIFLAVAVFMSGTAQADATRHYWTKAAFIQSHACPATGLHKLPCPGYVIDLRKPGACGGRASVANMRWVTVATAIANEKAAAACPK